ncbi:helix-turn-helix domain-containing protein [Paucibacter sp. O1-1]|nr:helix-turn-helix domain-containing protein [Paucibacter sp. O1-1]MDA3826567.1 helix-turn-helix domain-containing protein [Paucibacter sp. O1-1]
MSTINTHLLPAALRELVRVLGEGPAFRLVERRGGSRLILPRRVTPDHRYIDELGLKVFADLVDAYGGIVLDLPKYDAVLRQLRHERVRKLRAEKLTMDQIAMATGYSRRQVITILSDVDPEYRLLMRPEDRQVDLFPDFAIESSAAPTSVPGSANDPFGLAAKR